MHNFKYLVRTKLVVTLSGQSFRQNFGLALRIRPFGLPLHFIANDTLQKNVHGQPSCAEHLDYVYRLAFIIVSD